MSSGIHTASSGIRTDQIAAAVAPPPPGHEVRRTALDGLPEITDPLSVSPVDARTLSTSLFKRLGALDEGTPEYSYVRNTLVELNLSLVKFTAQRFRNRAEPMEDIVQVGTIGLIKAINRFDVYRGVEFASFALPTIVGEIKRSFRDTSWAVQVPRRLQELRIDLAKARDAMEQHLGRLPTAPELAEHLGITEAEVVEGERAANGYVARSLDWPLDDDEGSLNAVTRTLGEEDPAFDIVESVESLKPLIAGLGDRDRLILSLRFGEELTQSEIAARLGLSQMHVSRLLARICSTLRTALLDDAQPRAANGSG
ncbi:SigB/SigF/SigG family RNA polymerase sigma factor [Streptomyces sp. NPDC060064]|uniref:SigB/SigF/SigG family RNA polymerase sigma factor n=1 Tax=Streptomyces sp. NPDC060064 TaxID=3347049 RepID=UPI00369EB166